MPPEPSFQPTHQVRVGSLRSVNALGRLTDLTLIVGWLLGGAALAAAAATPAGPRTAAAQRPVPDGLDTAGSPVVERNPTDGLDYVALRGGTFVMGCSPGDECSPNEQPPHRVTVRPFWIGRTEVTVGAFSRFVAATGHVTDAERASDSQVLSPEGYIRRAGASWRSPGFAQGDSHPVVLVSWNDAESFCRWARGRLPTEAEWEYAARGGSAAARYGSVDEIAWYADNSGRSRIDSLRIVKAEGEGLLKRLGANGNQSQPVAKKKPNAYGLYDMLGNAAEFVNDWYDENYYRSSAARDPAGPLAGERRVARGKGWSSLPSSLRVTKRFGGAPSGRDGSTGFRCARDVPP